MTPCEPSLSAPWIEKEKKEDIARNPRNPTLIEQLGLRIPSMVSKESGFD